MLLNPRIGQQVCIHYRESLKSMPNYHVGGQGLSDDRIFHATSKQITNYVKLYPKL